MWKKSEEEKKKMEKKDPSINLDEIFGSEFESKNKSTKIDENSKYDTKSHETSKQCKSTLFDDSENEKMAEIHKKSLEKTKRTFDTKKHLNSAKDKSYLDESSKESSNGNANENDNIGKMVFGNEKKNSTFKMKNLIVSDESAEINNLHHVYGKNDIQNEKSFCKNNSSQSSARTIEYSDISISIDKDTNANIIKNINNLFLVSEYALCFQECKRFLDSNTPLFSILLKTEHSSNFQVFIEKLKKIQANSDIGGISIVKFLMSISKFYILAEHEILKNNDALINFIDRIKQLNKYLIAVAKKNQESRINQNLQKAKSVNTDKNVISSKSQKMMLGGLISANSDLISIDKLDKNEENQTLQTKYMDGKAMIKKEFESNSSDPKKSKDTFRFDENIVLNSTNADKNCNKIDVDAKIALNEKLVAKEQASDDVQDDIRSDNDSGLDPETELIDFIESEEDIEEIKLPSSKSELSVSFPFGFYLNYFDAVRGPKIFYELSIFPDSLITDEMLDTMNKNHGYYVLEVNQYIIYSYLFEIPSEISRGKIDLLQYAVCLNSTLFDVKNGDFSQKFRKYFMKAAQYFQNNKEIFLGLWYGREDSKPNLDARKMQSEYLKIMRITSELEVKVLHLLNTKKLIDKPIDPFENVEFKKKYIKNLSETLDLIEILSKSP